MTSRKAGTEPWLALGLGLTLLVAFVLIRALSLDADPPLQLPHGASSRELWAEWGAKAHEARNVALFGRWQVNPADNYGFWRPQAPLWVYSLASFLELFGVSPVAVRAHSILVASVGFVMTLLYAKKGLGLRAVLVAGCFMAFNCYYIFYTRAGLMEPMVNLFAAATVLTAYLSLSDPRWLSATTVCLILTAFSKSSGFYLVPVVFAAGVVALVRAHRASLPRSRWLLPVAISALLLCAVGLYATTDVYHQRTAWSFGHMAYNKSSATEVDLSKFELSAVLRRLFDPKRWTTRFFPLFPVAASCSVVALVYAVRNFVKVRRFDWDTLTALWFLAALASLQLTDRGHARYYLVLFPPVALLGARGVELILGAVRRWRFAEALVLLTVLGLFFQYHGSRYLNWWEHRRYEIRDTNRAVQRIIGEHADAVVIGMWSPWLVFDSSYENYIVRGYFNVEKAALEKLGVTHLLLLDRDLAGARFKGAFPKQYAKKKKLESFDVYGQKLTLYELPRASAGLANVKNKRR